MIGHGGGIQQVVESFELAPLGRDLRREADRDVRELLGEDLAHAALVRGVRVRVQETDARPPRPRPREARQRRAERLLVKGNKYLSRVTDSLAQPRPGERAERAAPA